MTNYILPGHKICGTSRLGNVLDLIIDHTILLKGRRLKCSSVPFITNYVSSNRDHGPISGEVLVYRHPGLHFGDIHVLTATYSEAIQDFVGDSKFAILFPVSGPRSLANEMAGGDFDGDMYWVSRNPQVGHCF